LKEILGSLSIKPGGCLARRRVGVVSRARSVRLPAARSDRSSRFPGAQPTALNALARETADLDAALVVGYVGRPDRPDELRAGNCAAVIEGGIMTFVQRKDAAADL
jgi:hypothetical protein